MSRSLLLILVGICGIVMDDPSHMLYAQDAYPRVMSPTGRFYGPTQAHYQYERQYGRPWPGGPAPVDANTGANFQVPGGWGGYQGYGGYQGAGGYPGYGGYSVFGGNVPFSNSGYGYGIQQQGFPILGGFGGPAYGGYGGYGGVSVYQNQFSYGPVQQYQFNPQAISPPFGFAPATTFSWQQPDVFQQQLQQQQQQQQQQANTFAPQPGNAGVVNPAAPPQPVLQRPHAFLPAQPSTVAQRQRSIHLQGQGDVWFRQQNYLQAYSRYKQAAAAASDLAAPRFRMAYALMALQRYELAIPELQRGIRLDPRYPLTGEGPQEVYGEDNQIAAAALPQAVAAWVKQDIRSSDRLFLLGALLMISGDNVRARVLLETAAQFGAEGPTEHILAFLKLDQARADVNPAPAAKLTEVDNRPPVPEAVEQMLKENKDWLPAHPPAKKTPAAPAAKVPLPPQPEPAGEAPAAAPVEAPQTAVPEPAAPPVTPPALEPGYVPVPKKGLPSEPTPAAPLEIEPASLEVPENSGPVIPNPASEK